MKEGIKMIKKETIEKSVSNYPNFKDDLQKLISLIDKDEFMNKVTNSVQIEFHKRFEGSDLTRSSIKSFVSVIYWNRFSEDIKVSFAYGTTFNFSSTGTDYLSWIPVLRFTESLFSEARLIKLYAPETVLSIQKVFNDFDKFKLFLSKKIKTKLNKNYKNYFDAKISNDYSSFISAYSRCENFPIDLFPLKTQFELFWEQTEIFSEPRASYKSHPYRLAQAILPDSGYGSCDNIIFEKDKINKSFADNYEKFSGLIIEIIFYKLNSESSISSFVLKRCLDFLRNQEKTSQNLKSYLKEKSIIEIIVDKQVSIMKEKLYCGSRILDVNPYELIDKNSPKSDKEILENKIIEMISEKTKLSEVADYYEKLDSDVYKMLLKNRTPMIEGFTSILSFQNRFKNFSNYKTLYSPIVFTEHGSYSMLVNRVFFSQNDFNKSYDEIENLLILKEIKTTKHIKNLCESLLRFLNSQLNVREAEHLRFVLSMDSID